MDHDAIRSALRGLVGPDGLIEAPAEVEPYLHDWRDRHHGRTIGVVRPRRTEEVSALLRYAGEHGIPVFPQGGNTSVCGGSVPSATGEGIVLAMTRMNRILDVNPRNNTLIAEAGCVLQEVQAAAVGVDRLFPLSLGAEGSCQIGGNIATNAGGTAVLRYGNMRDLVLGLEVVLPDGRVLDVLRTLRKDNSGYDLKNLFIGSEGTLGIVTAAALKLFPLPRHFVTTLFVGDSPDALVDTGLELQQRFQGELIALEIISRSEFEIALRHTPGLIRPFASDAQWYLLAEVATSADRAAAVAQLESCLEVAMSAGVIENAVIAASEEQRKNLWRIRHSVTDSNRREGMGLTHDIAVPTAAVPEFLRRAEAKVARAHPSARIVVVGHLGDGNLHYIVMFGHDAWKAVPDKPAFQHALGRMLYDIAADLGGTFSAEHGIGSLHLGEMARYKPAVELELMQQIKGLLDPGGIMNPGRVLPAPDSGSGSVRAGSPSQ